MKRREPKAPYVPPVQHIELDEKKIKPRVILTIIFFIIGVAAITFGVVSMTRTEDGWRDIEAKSELSGSCLGDIAFQYNLGASGVAAGVESRAISSLYLEAADEATKLYNNAYYVDTNNIYTLNTSPNTEITLEPELYSALELLLENDRREIFYAPYYNEYNSLFFCVNDVEAYDFDPSMNTEMAEYIASVAAFVNDEKHISLTLSDDNKATLNVSEEYLAFAEEYEITTFIDLYWMQNAFVIDYIADKMMNNGYYFGSLSTFDGYVRNLDHGSGYVYGYNIYDMKDNTVIPAAIMTYEKQLSIVNYRAFPMSDVDDRFYYEYDNGGIAHKYIGGDGYPISSTASLTAVSRELGCAEILVRTMGSYLAEELDENALTALDDIGVVYCRDGVVVSTTEDEIGFESFYEGYLLSEE